MTVNIKVVEAIRKALGPMPSPITNGEFCYRSILEFFIGVGPYKVDREQIDIHTYLTEKEIDENLAQLVDEGILVKTTRDSIFDDPDDVKDFYALNVDSNEEKEISNEDDERRAQDAAAQTELMKKEYEAHVNSKRPKQFVYTPPEPDEDSDDESEEDDSPTQSFTRSGV